MTRILCLRGWASQSALYSETEPAAKEFDQLPTEARASETQPAAKEFDQLPTDARASETQPAAKECDQLPREARASETQPAAKECDQLPLEARAEESPMDERSDWRTGQRVRVTGLQSRPDLESVEGVLVTFGVESGRWQVNLDGGHGAKACWLPPARCPLLERVLLHLCFSPLSHGHRNTEAYSHGVQDGDRERVGEQ